MKFPESCKNLYFITLWVLFSTINPEVHFKNENLNVQRVVLYLTNF